MISYYNPAFYGEITMEHTNWTEADSHKVKHVWTEYQRQHDITALIGQTAGIDPKTERIWFGDSALEIVQQRLAEGLTCPIFFERVGYTSYLRKGGCR